MTPNGNVIDVVIRLIDEVTGPLKSVGATVSRGFAQIRALGALALGGWTLNKFVGNIVEAERATAKLDVAYRNLGAAVGVSRARMDELATEIQRTTTFSDDAAKEAQALLLTFTRVRGEAFERTLKVAADLSAMMGIELTGAVRMLGRAAQDPTRGFFMLQRAGVVLTAQQREMIKSMAAAGNTAGAYVKLLELIDKKATGTAAAMRNTLGGAFTALQNQIGDLLEGDSKSFTGLIAAINDLTKALDDPRLKAGGDALVAGLVKIGEGALRATLGLAALARETAEYNARLAGGSDQVVQRIQDKLHENMAAQQETLRLIQVLERVAATSPGRGAGDSLARLDEQRRKLVALQTEETRLQQIRAQELREQARLVVPAVKAQAPKPQPQTLIGDALAAIQAVEIPPLKLGTELDEAAIEELTGTIKSIQTGLRSETEKAVEGIRTQIRAVAQAYVATDEQLASGGLTRQMLDETMADLQRAMDATIAKSREAGEEARKAQEALASAALLGAQQTVRAWDEAGQKIEQALAKGAITAEQATASRAALTEEIRASALTTAPRLPNVDDIQPKLELIRAALARGATTAEEARAEVEALVRSLREATQTGFAAEVSRWEAELRRLDQLALDPQQLAVAEQAARGLLAPLQALREASSLAMTDAERSMEAALAPLREMGAQIALLYQLLDTLPEELRIRLNLDTAQLDAAMAQVNAAVAKTAQQVRETQVEVSEFALQAARNIQNAFADMFMSLGKGWRDVVKQFLLGFARIFAEAASLNLVKALGLDDILSGKPATGGIGKWLERIFPRRRTTEAAAATSGGAGAATVPAAAGDCAASCAGRVAQAVGTSVGTTVGATLKQFGTGVLQSLRLVTTGLWKFVTTMLGRLWEFLKAAIEAIRTVASSSSGSSGGFIGAIVSGIGALFGASAGGGSLPAGTPRWVGEEGPELIVPGPGLMAYNQRQLAYAGGSSTSLNYAPTYNVKIEGARDDRAIMAQVAAFVTREDAKGKVEIMEMLRRNGFGRMTR